MPEKYFSFSGRLNRKPYWLRYLLIVFISMLVMIGISLMMSTALSGVAVGDVSGLFSGVGLIGLVLFLLVWAIQMWSIISLAVRRLHDRDKSGWWVAAVFGVGFITGTIGENLGQTVFIVLNVLQFIVIIWFFIELGFLRGTKGANKYGPDPLSGEMADPNIF